jgi:hypothetical protein
VSNVPNPGLRNQPQLRNFFRVAGIILFGAGVLMIVLGFMALFGAMNDDSFGPPKQFFLAFVGMPVTAVGGWCLQAGFMGAGARYAAGETMPVVRDSAAYLTNGEGILGVGRTVDAAPAQQSGRTGPFCSKCGVRNDEGASFCDACGASLA